MTRLQLSLFGSPRLEADGAPIEIATRKALALLVYLALADAPASRESLAARFWPEQDERKARGSLRRALWVIRQGVGDGILVAGRSAVSIAGDAELAVDVHQFRDLLADCLNANATGANFAPCAESLTAAVALYTGDFLTGFTLPDAPAFDEWVFFQAESYRRALAQALQQLTAWHTNLAEFDAAIEYARRWLALDPLHEAAHRELMGLYAWDGQQAAAVRQYQECVRILENELGVPPEEETVALYEAIRTRRLSAPIGQPVEASIPSSPLHPLTLPPLPGFLRQESDSPPIPELFVARSQELLRLDGYLDKAMAGEGQIVFVRGEAGRGKSSLLNAFVRRSQARHPELLVAWGRCDAHTSAGNPYLPWRECTALLTGDVEARWAAGEISRTHAQRLWYALPVAAQALIEQAPALLDSFVPAAALAERAAVGWSGAAWLAQLRSRLVDDREWQPVEQDRLFAHFLRFLQALAARQPLLLLLDDLHWVDGSSADLLFHLVRRLGSAPVLIVGAFRGEEVQGESHPLQAALVELQRTFGDITLDLDEADRGGGRAFVDAFLDSEDNRLGEAFRAELTQRTGGHPLFTVELVQEMQDRGGLRQDEDGYWVETGALDWKRLPGRVEATVAARFNRLERSAREMLTVGSVEGEEFTAEVIARVLGVEPLTVVRGLSGGADRQHQLVRSLGSQRIGDRRLSRYRFRHNLFQRYLYSTLDDTERAYLHEAVGNALEALVQEQTDALAEMAASLTRHFSLAGDDVKAAEYAVKAGDASLRAVAIREARIHYADALDAFTRIDDATRFYRMRIDTIIKYTDIAWFAIATMELLPLVKEAESLAHQFLDGTDKADRRRFARLHLALGTLHFMLSDNATALTYLQPLILRANESGDEQVSADASVLVGWIYAWRGRFAEAVPLIRRFLAHCEAKGNWRKWVQWVPDLSIALAGLGSGDEARTLLQRCIRIGRGIREDFTTNGPLYLALIDFMTQDEQQELEALQSFIHSAEQSGSLAIAMAGYLMEAHQFSRLGNSDQARRSVENQERLAQQLGGEPAADLYTAIKAEIALYGSQYDQAIALAQKSLTLAEEMDGLWAAGFAHRIWAQATAASRDAPWEEIEAHLQASLKALAPGEARLEMAHTHAVWGKVLAQRGDFEEARAHLDAAAAQYEWSGLAGPLAQVRGTLLTG